MRTLSWRLQQTRTGPDRSEMKATIVMALNAWSKAAGIQFKEEKLDDPEILFIFGRTSRPYHTAEHIQSDGKHLVVFSDSVKWKPIKPGWWGAVKRNFFQQGADLLTFALHELGHVIGLPHVSYLDDKDSVMIPRPEASGLVSKPSEMDGQLARELNDDPPADVEETLRRLYK